MEISVDGHNLENTLNLIYNRGLYMDISQKILSDITVFNKYAKFISELGRRENWQELCNRNMSMHIKKYPLLKDEIESVYNDYVLPKKVLPSMRSLQFAGRPIELAPNRIFNCAYLAIDDIAAFWETMFLLLGGCFKEGTLVKTKCGDKPIEAISTDDEILTFDTETNEYYWIHPTWSGMTPTAGIQKIELELENGTIIHCTENHKFYTKNRGWVEAKDLNDIDDIETFNNVYELDKSAIPNSKIIDEQQNRDWFPDITTNSVIVEVFGDYWHANPKFYTDNDILFTNKTAKEIRTNDKNV
jgi:hypothetical protein